MTKKLILSISILAIFMVYIISKKTNNDYQLKIEKGKLLRENNKIYWIFPTKFSNNTDDTLKFYSMNCSWTDFYAVDNKNLEILGNICDKNFPVILELPPKTILHREIKLILNSEQNEQKFKIGFNLIPALKDANYLDFSQEKLETEKNIIWSNTISMP